MSDIPHKAKNDAPAYCKITSKEQGVPGAVEHELVQEVENFLEVKKKNKLFLFLQITKLTRLFSSFSML